MFQVVNQVGALTAQERRAMYLDENEGDVPESLTAAK